MDSQIVALRRRNLRKWIDDEFGGVQAKFIAVTEINQGEVSSLLKSNSSKSFGEKKARSIEALAGMPEMYLDTEHDQNIPTRSILDNNVNLSLKHILRRIPVISWVQAGYWRGVEYYSDDDLEYIEITTDIKDGFGLRVQGDSMMPEFAQGDIIVVAPHAQPENGSYVVVIQDDTNEATFKKLVYDGAKPYFKPLNPQYPMLESNENTRIVGVVKQKIKLY